MFSGTPSSQSSRDPSRETSRDPSPTQYLHNQYRPQLPRPPMPPINGPRNSNILPPPPRTSQPYSPVNLYSAHNQYVARQNIAVSTSSTAFASQPSQEMHRPMIPSNQIPPVAKNLTPVSAPSTFADTIKSEPAKMNQSYQWATSPPLTNIPQGTMSGSGVTSSIDKTSQVSTNQTESQTSFARVNKILTYDQGHSIPPSASNANLPPSNITQHLNQNNYVQQEPVSSSIQPPRTQNVQAQSTISPSESLNSSQLRYGTQQNISSASSMPNSSTQNLFYSTQSHNIGPRNPQEYNTPPLKPQNLLTGYMDPTGLGNIPQGQNVHQNLVGQRKYPQDTANTAMLPPSGGNQLHGARLPPSGMPPLPGQQTVIKSKNIMFKI